MARNTLIASRDEAVANIPRYRDALKDDRHGAALRKSMPMVHVWYAVRPPGEEWSFAPSKFIGYPGNTAEAYFRDRNARRGRDTERILRRWFHVVRPGTRLAGDLEGALRDFLRRYGHSAPRKDFRICVPAEVLDDAGEAPEASDRIAVDPAVCGGRPHVRGTRVRVSDVLRLMASGAATKEILADYPYLKDADLRAALAFGAAAVDHRIVPAG